MNFPYRSDGLGPGRDEAESGSSSLSQGGEVEGSSCSQVRHSGWGSRGSNFGGSGEQVALRSSLNVGGMGSSGYGEQN